VLPTHFHSLGNVEVELEVEVFDEAGKGVQAMGGEGCESYREQRRKRMVLMWQGLYADAGSWVGGGELAVGQ